MTDIYGGIENNFDSGDEIKSIQELINQNHKHQFTIPVEWRPRVEWNNPSIEGMSQPQIASLIARSPITVTKLRCACGEETTR